MGLRHVVKHETDSGYNAYYQCPFCACIFMNMHDLSSHMKAFGHGRNEHSEKWNKELEERKNKWHYES